MAEGRVRTNWDNWEKGRTKVPDDVLILLRGMLAWHAEKVAEWQAQIANYVARAEEGFNGTIELLIYENPQAFMDHTRMEEATLWRPHCSAMAMLAATNPNVLLVYKASPGTREPQPVQ